jgi:hypothetical protein
VGDKGLNLEALPPMAYQLGEVADGGPCVAQELARFLLFVLTDEKRVMDSLSTKDIEAIVVSDTSSPNQSATAAAATASRGRRNEDSKGKSSKRGDNCGQSGTQERRRPIDLKLALAVEFDPDRGDTEVHGDFPIGVAHRATIRGIPAVVKIANTYKDRCLVPEVQNEERVFDKVIALQGDVVPRLLYSGPMIGGRHVIATWDRGQTMDAWAENASAQDKAIVGAEARVKLRRLHEAGVLHRKIKAQNIAVDKDNNTVRLID